MPNKSLLDEIKEDLNSGLSDMYNKGTISGLELIKEYVELDKEVTVDGILKVCDWYISRIKESN